MAEDITSWISKSIIQHDSLNGANHKIPIRGKYAQVIKFSSYRDEFDPHAEIRGVISDKTHWIRVKFDIDATDEFEEPTASLPPESLTSNLRSIFLIESFRIHLSPPPNTSRRKSLNTPSGDLPDISLEILKWRVINGDKSDPVFYTNTSEVGKGKGDVDVQVQRVLRKWWFGESNSSQTHVPSTSQYPLPLSTQTPSRYNPLNPSSVKPLISSPLAGYHSSPAILSTSNPISQNDQPTQSHGRDVDHGQKGKVGKRKPGEIMLLDFLQPYLNPPGGGKKKAIPEWLFHKSDEVKVMLDDINMFGLDLHLDQEEEEVDGAGRSEKVGNGKGKEKETHGTYPIRNDDTTEVGEGNAKKRESILSVEMPTTNSKIDDSAYAPGQENQGTPSIEPAQRTPQVRMPSHLNLSDTDEDDLQSPIFRENSPNSPSPIKNRKAVPLVQNQASPGRQRQKPEEEEESEDDILVKPRRILSGKKRGIEMFDPLSMPSSSPAREEGDMDIDVDDEEKQGAEDWKVQEEEEEDEDDDDLSDYEKEQKRKAKRTQSTSEAGSTKKRKTGYTATIQSERQEFGEQLVPESASPIRPTKPVLHSVGTQTANEAIQGDSPKKVIVPQDTKDPSQVSELDDSQKIPQEAKSQVEGSQSSSIPLIQSQSQKRKISEILVDDSDQSLSQHKSSNEDQKQVPDGSQLQSSNNSKSEDQDQSVPQTQAPVPLPDDPSPVRTQSPADTRSLTQSDPNAQSQAKPPSETSPNLKGTPCSHSLKTTGNDKSHNANKPLSLDARRPLFVQDPSSSAMVPTHPTHISASDPTYSLIPPAPPSSNRPKVEHFTPTHPQTPLITRTPGKGSRKSFLSSIKFFPSSSASARKLKVVQDEEEKEDESPLKKRQKVGDESILGKLGRWARRGSPAGTAEVTVGDASQLKKALRPYQNEDVAVEGEEEGDGLDDGLDHTGDLDSEVEVIVIDDDEEEEEVEEVRNEVKSEVNDGGLIEGLRKDPEVSSRKNDEVERDDGGLLLQVERRTNHVCGNYTHSVSHQIEQPETKSESAQKLESSNQGPLSTSKDRNKNEEEAQNPIVIPSEEVQPMTRARKLGRDFKLDFGIDGLLEQEVRKAIESMERARSRKVGK